MNGLPDTTDAIGAEALAIIDEIERARSQDAFARADEFQNRSPEHARIFKEQVAKENGLPLDIFERITKEHEEAMTRSPYPYSHY